MPDDTPEIDRSRWVAAETNAGRPADTAPGNSTFGSRESGKPVKAPPSPPDNSSFAARQKAATKVVKSSDAEDKAVKKASRK